MATPTALASASSSPATAGSFQNALGVVVASGQLVFQLSQAAAVSGGGEIAPTKVVINLDINGKVAPNQSMYRNTDLLPLGTTYGMQLLDGSGNKIADFGAQIITGAGPIDLSVLTPTLIGGTVIGFPSSILQNPTSDQTISNGFVLNNTGPIRESSGSAAVPSYSFISNTNRGFYNDVANSGIGFSVAGAEVANVTATGLGLFGATSGTATLAAPAIAGSSVLTLPAATDTLIAKATTDVLTNKTLDTAGAGNVLKINGTQVSAVTGSASAVVLQHNPTLDATLSFTESAAPATVGGTDILYGDSTAHRLKLSNGIVGYDNVVTASTTDVFTNKTFDTAGTGNVFKISGTTVSGVTGTGAIVLANTPTLITPVLGVATATSVNKVAITAPATGSTLTVADGKTLTANNSLTLAGTDGTTQTFQATDTIVGRATTDTLTNKTYDTGGTGNVFKISGTTVSGVTGTGNVVLATGPTISAQTISSGGLSFTEAATVGSLSAVDLIFGDSTSHRLKISNNNVAGGAVLGDSTTDTLTNKTFDTAGTGNVLKINGTQVSAITGTGSVVLATGPTFPTSITIGVEQGFTEVAAAGIAIASGFSVLYADSTAHRLKLSNNAGSLDNVVTAASTDTLTNKTLTTPTITSPSTTGTDSGTETLQNKRLTPRQVSMADATSVTPTSDTADINTFTSTQTAGTLTVNAPSGTPTDGQKLILRLKSTNAQTYSFNATYAFSTTVTAPTTLAAGKTDYIGIMWNATNTKWDAVAVDQGH